MKVMVISFKWDQWNPDIMFTILEGENCLRNAAGLQAKIAEDFPDHESIVCRDEEAAKKWANALLGICPSAR